MRRTNISRDVTWEYEAGKERVSQQLLREIVLRDACSGVTRARHRQRSRFTRSKQQPHL